MGRDFSNTRKLSVDIRTEQSFSARHGVNYVRIYVMHSFVRSVSSNPHRVSVRNKSESNHTLTNNDVERQMCALHLDPLSYALTFFSMPSTMLHISPARFVSNYVNVCKCWLSGSTRCFLVLASYGGYVSMEMWTNV